MSGAFAEQMVERPLEVPTFSLADAKEMMKVTAKRRHLPPPDPRVYLLHFDQPFGLGKQFCRHYLGTAYDVYARVKKHSSGKSDSKFMRHVIAAGVKIVLARTWPGGRDLERRLKENGHFARLCPICQAQKYAERMARKHPGQIAFELVEEANPFDD